MIDLEWYRSFIAVYRQGTVSRAAAALFITQPAVSQHIGALETALGVTLFQRTPRRMLPTEQAKELYARIAPAIDTLEQAVSEIGNNHRAPLRLRLGAPLEYFSEIVVAQLAQAQIHYRVRFDMAPTLLEALEKGELDLVIVTQRLTAQGLEYTRLRDETFLLVGAATHGYPGDDGIDAADLPRIEQWLAQRSWISYGPELPIIRRFWQQSFGKRPELLPSLTLPNLHAIKRAILVNAGISLLPDYLCHEDARLRVLWTPPSPVTNEIWLVIRRQDRANAAIRQMFTILGAG